MKMFHFAKLLVFILSLRIVSATPYILEVTKKSNLFERPSAKSQVLAEAEEGVMLLLVDISKQGRWLKIKDAEGTEGWIPVNRTDYGQIHKAREVIEDMAIEDKNIEKEYRKRALEAEKISKLRKWKIRLAPIYRIIDKKLPNTPSYGGRFDWVYGMTPIRNESSFALNRLGFSATVPTVGHGYSGTLQYSSVMPVWGPLFYAPEIAYSFDKVAHANRHHLSLSVGAGVQFNIFDLGIKVGYDFFSNSRAHGEVQIGCTF